MIQHQVVEPGQGAAAGLAGQDIASQEDHYRGEVKEEAESGGQQQAQGEAGGADGSASEDGGAQEAAAEAQPKKVAKKATAMQKDIEDLIEEAAQGGCCCWTMLGSLQLCGAPCPHLAGAVVPMQ